MGIQRASRKFAIWSQLMSRIAGWGDGKVPSLRTKGVGSRTRSRANLAVLTCRNQGLELPAMTLPGQRTRWSMRKLLILRCVPLWVIKGGPNSRMRFLPMVAGETRPTGGNGDVPWIRKSGTSCGLSSPHELRREDGDRDPLGCQLADGTATVCRGKTFALRSSLRYTDRGPPQFETSEVRAKMLSAG